MLMDHHRPDVAVVGAIDMSRKKFTVEVNSMMFRAAIDGIYSDKIRAPVRELLTNAWDGHKAAGKEDIPFDVQLPTALEPIFRVRDYGIGLSYDDIMGLYTTLYASSKRQSNDSVGMLGLGSKSPFAYTNSFTVTSWYGGKRMVFSCFLGEDDVPEIVEITSGPSAEPEGIEVQFSVKMNDLKAFQTAAEYVFPGFSPRPNLLNMGVKIAYPEVEVEGNGWQIVKDNKGIRAKQGCVLYPINRTAVTGSSYHYGYSKIWDLSIIIDFPIGALSVATSREALGNDERTKSNVLEQIKRIETEITGKLQAKVDACTTYLNACKLQYAERQYGTMEQTLWSNYGKNLKWGGKDLVGHFNWSATQAPNMYQVSRKVANSAFPSPTFQGPKSISVQIDQWDDTLFVLDDVDKFSLSRMRTVLIDGGYQHYIWVRGDATAMLAHFQNPAHVRLSDFEPTKVTREKRAEVQKLPTTQWSGHGLNGQETLDANTGGVYVTKKDNQFFIGERSYDRYPFDSHYRTLKQEGIIDGTTKLWNFTSRHEKLKKNPKWENLEDLIKRELPKKINKSNYLAQQSLASLPREDIVEFCRRNKARVAWPKEISEFLTEFEAMKFKPENSSSILQLYETYFPGELAKLQAAAHPLLVKLQAIKTRWPLLRMIANSYSLSDEDIAGLNHYLSVI